MTEQFESIFRLSPQFGGSLFLIIPLLNSILIYTIQRRSLWILLF